MATQNLLKLILLLMLLMMRSSLFQWGVEGGHPQRSFSGQAADSSVPPSSEPRLNACLATQNLVAVVDVDDEDRLLQIWKLRFGYKANLLFRLWAQGLVKILMLKCRRDFEAEVWSVFCCWCLVEVTKLNLGQDSEARFGQDIKLKFSRDTDVWLRFWSQFLIFILKL